ncbi:MAG TPA: sugar phosphate isomerase/epimerase [Planctomycetota bacterium]|nr:sugar phosphate isomerase/epimerase [Planctomycetota bacterium]
MGSLRFGYNTNGFPHHRLEDVLHILADLGYQGVALTLDVHHLDPLRASGPEVAAVAHLLERLRLQPVVETGARFVLDPRRKHEPSLLTADPAGRGRRIEFLRRCIWIAAGLGARVVSLWSGRPPEGEARPALEARLAESLRALSEEALRSGLALALEPEPGMLVETLADFTRASAAVDRPNLGLCLDIGHLYCTGETPVGPRVRELGPRILTSHVEDAPRGRHEHRMFGEGEVDLVEALHGFRSIGYGGLLNVELSRHGHEAPAAAERAIRALRDAEAKIPGEGALGIPT